MATAKSTMTTTEAQDIQRRMAQVRRELHQDAQEVVRGAQSILDWKSVITGHPWVALGITATVGYLLVPRRQPPVAPTILTLPAGVTAAEPLVASAASKSPAKSKTSRWGVLGTAFSLVAPIAVRAAQNYAMNYVEQFLAGQALGGPPMPMESPATGRSSAAGNDLRRPGAANF